MKFTAEDWKNDVKLIDMYQNTTNREVRLKIEEYFFKRYTHLKYKVFMNKPIHDIRVYDSYFYTAIKKALAKFDTKKYTNFYTYLLWYARAQMQTVIGDELYNGIPNMYSKDLKKKIEKAEATEYEKTRAMRINLIKPDTLPETYEYHMNSEPPPPIYEKELYEILGKMEEERYLISSHKSNKKYENDAYKYRWIKYLVDRGLVEEDACLRLLNVDKKTYECNRKNWEYWEKRRDDKKLGIKRNGRVRSKKTTESNATAG